MPSQFTTTRRVEFCETDGAGIVHFTNFYRYMEQAEHEFFRSLGFSIMQATEDGGIVGWPRVAASCSFEAPAFFEDVLEITLTVRKKSAKSLTLGFEFYREGTRIAVGEMQTVCCYLAPGDRMRSIPIPEEYDAQIEEAAGEKS